MTSESVHARHLVELGFLQDAVRELGMRSTLIERSNDVAYHTLLVSLAADAKGRERQLALNYYPLEDEEFEDTLFLQYFIGLSTEVKQATLPAIREFLPAINNKVVIGHFGITEGTTQLHFRYVQALPSEEVIDKDKVANVLTLASYTPVLFDDVLEDLASGTLTVAEANKRLDTIYAS